MSHVDVSRFVTLALDDEHVRGQLETDPDGAFRGYDLTDEERDAIRSANEEKLRHLGLDPMTAHSWAEFHNLAGFAPDMPDAPGDLPPGRG